MFFNLNHLNWYKILLLLISMLCICFKFEFISQVCCKFHPIKVIILWYFENSCNFLVMFDWLHVADFVAYNIVEMWNNDVCSWWFNDNYANSFFRSFDVIWYLRIALHRTYVSEHGNVGEHVGFRSSIQLVSCSFSYYFLDNVALVFT